MALIKLSGIMCDNLLYKTTNKLDTLGFFSICTWYLLDRVEIQNLGSLGKPQSGLNRLVSEWEMLGMRLLVAQILRSPNSPVNAWTPTILGNPPLLHTHTFLLFAILSPSQLVSGPFSDSKKTGRAVQVIFSIGNNMFPWLNWDLDLCMHWLFRIELGRLFWFTICEKTTP